MYRFQILVGLSGEVSGLVPITEAQVVESKWTRSDN